MIGHRPCSWVPGSALTRRPGTTTLVVWALKPLRRRSGRGRLGRSPPTGRYRRCRPARRPCAWSDRPGQFGDGTIGVDEAGVGGAAGGAEFGGAAGHRADRRRQMVADQAGRYQEGFAADLPGKRVFAADAGKPLVDPGLELVAGPQIVEADVEGGLRLAGDHIGGRVADIDRGDLQPGSLEMLGAAV